MAFAKMKPSKKTVQAEAPIIVEPEPFSDRSYLESVSDLIQDATSSQDQRDEVLWARFEEADVNDVRLLRAEECDHFRPVTVPLLLCIGYVNGYEVWLLQYNGRAQQVVSVRGQPVELFRFLRTPAAGGGGTHDGLKKERPLVALSGVHLGSPLPEGSNAVVFRSLSTGWSNVVRFCSPIQDIQSNHRVVAVATARKVSLLDAGKLDGQVVIKGFSHQTADLVVNPIALGDGWLAYSDCRLHAAYECYGGASTEGSVSMTASVLDAARASAATIGQGMNFIGRLSGRLPSPQPPGRDKGVDGGETLPGVVTVVDFKILQNSKPSQNRVRKMELGNEGPCPDFVRAHFVAHEKETVVKMEFDRAGVLLMTCGASGRYFHVFSIKPHIVNSRKSTCQHIYTLHRGDTLATVQNIAFSVDSRWVAVSTLRGTTHVFPISPYGGKITARTHLSAAVVNQQSLFHTSAGLENTRYRPPPLSASVPSTFKDGVPSSSSLSACAASSLPSGSVWSSLSSLLGGNPSCGAAVASPPLVSTDEVEHVTALVQIKHVRFLGSRSIGSSSSLVSTASNFASSFTNWAGSSSSSSSSDAPTLSDVFVAAAFGLGRFNFNSGAGRGMARKDLPVDSLFIFTSDSRLIEHRLQPVAKNSSRSLYSAIDMTEAPIASWDLRRRSASSRDQSTAGEMRLADENPLVSASRRISALSQHFSVPGTEKEGLSASQSDCQDRRLERSNEWRCLVEPYTYSEPHRRIWEGPQFTVEDKSDEVVLSSKQPISAPLVGLAVARSEPRNVPQGGREGRRKSLTVLSVASSSDGSMPLMVKGDEINMEARMREAMQDCSPTDSAISISSSGGGGDSAPGGSGGDNASGGSGGDSASGGVTHDPPSP